VADPAIADAIDLTNTSRRLLQQVAALRAVDPPRISGVDALQMIATCRRAPRRRACAARVDGAIFFVMEGGGVHIWDTPDEIAALERNEVASLYLTGQPHRLDDPEPLRARLSEFVAALRR